MHQRVDMHSIAAVWLGCAAGNVAWMNVLLFRVNYEFLQKYSLISQFIHTGVLPFRKIRSQSQAGTRSAGLKRLGTRRDSLVLIEIVINACIFASDSCPVIYSCLQFFHWNDAHVSDSPPDS